MAEPILPGAPVPVLAATQGRLTWRAVATWIQAAGAAVGAYIVAASQLQTTIAPLIPVKYAWLGAAVFAAGKMIEAVQHQKDVTRPKHEVNMSGDTRT